MAYNKTDQSVKIGQYVKEYLKRNGISTNEAARRLGVKAPFVSMHLNGRPFSKNQAERWAKEFGLDDEFLTTGKGLASGMELVALSPEERQLIASYRKNNPSVLIIPESPVAPKHALKKKLRKRTHSAITSTIAPGLFDFHDESVNWVMDSIDK
jgi:plasmid maintenance system antidote protein VapI